MLTAVWIVIVITIIIICNNEHLLGTNICKVNYVFHIHYLITCSHSNHMG